MTRPARPDDLYRLRVPTEPRLSPDGRRIVTTLKATAPAFDGYRSALWIAPADGSDEPRRLTFGPRTDRHPRFAPDGRTLAFLSDRRHAVEEEPALAADHRTREDGTQVYLLPLCGGEARRLTDLPRGVEAFEWSPDGRHLAILTTSFGATREEDGRKRGRRPKPRAGTPPESDYRYLDRLDYLLNGTGFTDGRVRHLWLVDVASGAARPLVVGPTAERDIAWSPDSTRIAFTANRRRDHDIAFRSDIFVVDVAGGEVTAVTGGRDAVFGALIWTPDGGSLVAIGGRHPRVGYRAGIVRFAADGSDARRGAGVDLLDDSALMPGSTMNSDITAAEPPRLAIGGDGRSVLVDAPVDGSNELWRVALDGGAPERLTSGRQYVSAWDAVVVDGNERVALVRSAGDAFPDLHVLEDGTMRRLSRFNADIEAEVAWIAPLERRWMSDGREIQGWLVPAAGDGPAPLVLEIHGGPHTLYGWSPMWEWQVLAGAGMSVLAANPRGSEGYGEAFNRANLGDWGDGPMADVLAGVDAGIADGLADPARLGVTGGSYGGYLTTWIVGSTDRFRAAVTCRSVADMAVLFTTGDIAGGEWAVDEFGRTPWDDPAYFRAISPISLASRIRTPLLIQHAERDLRTTVGQAEALFTVLRSLRRPVRFMRVPEESHELTRAGTPFRRVENVVQIRDWFAHFLVRGGKRLPPVPKVRGGR